MDSGDTAWKNINSLFLKHDLNKKSNEKDPYENSVYASGSANYFSIKERKKQWDIVILFHPIKTIYWSTIIPALFLHFNFLLAIMKCVNFITEDRKWVTMMILCINRNTFSIHVKFECLDKIILNSSQRFTRLFCLPSTFGVYRELGVHQIFQTFHFIQLNKLGVQT